MGKAPAIPLHPRAYAPVCLSLTDNLPSSPLASVKLRAPERVGASTAVPAPSHSHFEIPPTLCSPATPFALLPRSLENSL